MPDGPQVSDVDITCTTDWAYEWHFFKGSGKASVEGSQNSIDATLAIHSNNFSRDAPTHAQLQVHCVFV